MARPLEIPAGDIGTRHLAIKRMLAESLDEAYDKLIDFADSFGSDEQKNDAIVISSDFFEYRKALKRSVINLDEFTNKRKNIMYRFLDLLDDIVREQQSLLGT
jgi:hypothetical protein